MSALEIAPSTYNEPQDPPLADRKDAESRTLPGCIVYVFTFDDDADGQTTYQSLPFFFKEGKMHILPRRM